MATRSLRVLHAPIEIAGQMGITVRALRKLGVDTVSCSYYDNNFRYPCDINMGLENVKGKMARVLKQLWFTFRISRKIDVMHFHFGHTLLPWHLDLPILKMLGKKIVMEFWGSDVRQKSKALSRNPWFFDRSDENFNIKNLKSLATYINMAIVADYELFEYVKDIFSEVKIVPQRIIIDDYQIFYPDPEKEKPLIVHAPTDREAKGTDYVMKAIEALKNNYEFEFLIVEGKSHAEATSIYRQSDIVVDQLRTGTHGLLAVEAMAMGKPVITYIREDLLTKYPAGLPIVSANPTTIYEKLKELIEDGQLRHDLGVRGRKYVEENHDALKVATKIIEIYSEL